MSKNLLTTPLQKAENIICHSARLQEISQSCYNTESLQTPAKQLISLDTQLRPALFSITAIRGDLSITSLYGFNTPGVYIRLD